MYYQSKQHRFHWYGIYAFIIRNALVCLAHKRESPIYSNIIQYKVSTKTAFFLFSIIIRCDAIKFHSNMHRRSGKYVPCEQKNDFSFFVLLSGASVCMCVCLRRLASNILCRLFLVNLSAYIFLSVKNQKANAITKTNRNLSAEKWQCFLAPEKSDIETFYACFSFYLNFQSSSL